MTKPTQVPTFTEEPVEREPLNPTPQRSGTLRPAVQRLTYEAYIDDPAYLPYLPQRVRDRVKGPGSSAPTPPLDDVARPQQDQEQAVAGDLSTAALAYGRVQRSGKFLTARNDGPDLICSWGLCFAGVAGIDGVERVTFGDVEAATLGVTYTVYTGQPGAANFGQVDPALAAADPTYDDTGVYVDPLTGETLALAYLVARIPADAAIGGWPNPIVRFRGMRVYDSRDGAQDVLDPTTWTFSRTPALALRDILAARSYGANLPPIAASVDALADINDELVGGSPRHTIDLLIERNSRLTSIIEALRTYASCFIAPSGAQTRLVPDRPASVERDLDADTLGRSFVMEPKQLSRVPNVIRVTYTDQSAEPWRDAVVEVRAPGANVEGVQRVPLPGVSSHEVAYRHALERLNKLYMERQQVRWTVDDTGLVDQVGGVYTLTDPGRALAGYPVRALEGRLRSGAWQFRGVTYDAGAWSNAVVSGPAQIQPGLADPRLPVAPDPVTFVEELFSDESGKTYSRMRVSWDAVAWAYASGYAVEITGAGVALNTIVDHRPGQALSAVTGPVEQGQTYTVNVRTIGPYSRSTAATAAVIAQGKLLRPTAPVSANASQVGEFVRIVWDPAEDIDLEGYQVRRGVPPQTIADWDSLPIVASKTDVEYALEPGVPLGNHRYFVRSVDSRYRGSSTPEAAFSAQAAIADIEITPGSTVTSFDTRESTFVTQHQFSLSQLDGLDFWVTDTGQVWSDRFTLSQTWAAAANRADEVWPVPSVGKTTPFLESAELDFGEDRQGIWSRQKNVQELGTGHNYDLLLFLADAASYPTFTQWNSASVQARARYAKLRIVDNGDQESALAVRDQAIVSLAEESEYSGNLAINGHFLSWYEPPPVVPDGNIYEYAADLYHVMREGAPGGVTVDRVPGRPNGRATYAMRIQHDQGDANTAPYQVSYAWEQYDVAPIWGSYLTLDFWAASGVGFSIEQQPQLQSIRSDVVEGSWDDIEQGDPGAVIEQMLPLEGVLPPWSSGVNAWTRRTVTTQTPIPPNTVGLAVRFLIDPPGTAAPANDYVEIAELQALRGRFAPANVPQFQSPDFATTRAAIYRYLVASSLNNQEGELSYTMRVTPTKERIGSPPFYRYDARL